MTNLSDVKTTKNRSPGKVSRAKSPSIKRVTTLKGMGNFHKITNKNLISNAIVKNLLVGEIWRNEREEALNYLDTSANGHF